MRDASFTDYIHSLSRYDYSIWKPIRNKRKPNVALPSIRATTPTAGLWARSDKEKPELFAQHFANIFTPHNDAKDHEIERNLTAPMNSNQTLRFPAGNQGSDQIFGIKEAPGLDQVTPKILKELPQKKKRESYYQTTFLMESYVHHTGLNNLKSHK
jgi:hypothetical protein